MPTASGLIHVKAQLHSMNHALLAASPVHFFITTKSSTFDFFDLVQLRVSTYCSDSTSTPTTYLPFHTKATSKSRLAISYHHPQPFVLFDSQTHVHRIYPFHHSNLVRNLTSPSYQLADTPTLPPQQWQAGQPAKTTPCSSRLCKPWRQAARASTSSKPHSNSSAIARSGRTVQSREPHRLLPRTSDENI